MPLPPVIQKMPEIRGVKPRAVLDMTPVHPADRGLQGLFVAELTFDYDGQRGFWPGTQNRVLIGQGSQARLLLRDLPSERKAWDALAALGLETFDANRLVLPPDVSTDVPPTSTEAVDWATAVPSGEVVRGAVSTDAVAFTDSAPPAVTSVLVRVTVAVACGAVTGKGISADVSS